MYGMNALQGLCVGHIEALELGLNYFLMLMFSSGTHNNLQYFFTKRHILALIQAIKFVYDRVYIQYFLLRTET